MTPILSKSRAPLLAAALVVAAVLVIAAALLVAPAIRPALAQGFWSPREIVLDTYTPPIPFNCGGETCLAYELHITNLDQNPIDLRSIEVRSRRATTSLKTYPAESLQTNLTGIRSRQRGEPGAIVEPGQRAILHVTLCVAERADVPEALLHRVSYSFLRTGQPDVASVTEGGALEVDARSTVPVLGPPLGEGIWFLINGVTDGRSGHRGGPIRPQNGIPVQKARYAFDITRIGEDGVTLRGSRSDNESYVTYGSEVLAVADSRVAAVQDSVPDSRPLDQSRLEHLTAETLAGNYVVLDLGNDLYALYGHLKAGSIRVREGERVVQGQVIGLVGNSGNSDQPHLHFQVNRAIPIRGEAVPYVFSAFALLQVVGASPLSGRSVAATRVEPSMVRHQEMPRSRSIVRFRRD